MVSIRYILCTSLISTCLFAGPFERMSQRSVVCRLDYVNDIDFVAFDLCLSMWGVIFSSRLYLEFHQSCFA